MLMSTNTIISKVFSQQQNKPIYIDIPNPDVNYGVPVVKSFCLHYVCFLMKGCVILPFILRSGIVF